MMVVHFMVIIIDSELMYSCSKMLEVVTVVCEGCLRIDVEMDLVRVCIVEEVLWIWRNF